MKLAKRVTNIVLAVAMICSLNIFAENANFSLITEAVSVTDELKYDNYLLYKQVDKDENGTYDYAEITGCDKSAVKIVIPSEINGLPVKSIGGEYAFRDCISLISVEIPNSVTSISYYSFLGCTSLTGINVSEKNENYSSMDGVLYNKTQTELIRYPDGKKDKIYSIPSSVTLIGDGAFFGSSLTNIEMPDGLKIIGQNAFSDCVGLTNIKIPDSVTTMEMFAFYNCSSLTGIEISNSVSYISYSIFYGCTSLKSVKIPDSVTKIGNYAFQGCSGLTSIEVPKFGLSLIGEGAFYGCNSLTGIEIPKSVTEIRGSAFYGCSSLTSLEIPSRVTSIGEGAFNNCSSLTSIDVLENNGNYSSTDGVLFNKTQTELIKYPEGKTGKNYFIAGSVTSIGGHAFSNCGSLKKVRIPSGVKTIGNYAFSNCSGLENIDVPDSVTSIGSGAFCNCSSLTSVTIKNSNCEIFSGLYGGNTICNKYNNDTNTRYYNGIIYGYEGSTAQAYAEKYDYKFEALSENPVVTTTATTTTTITTTTATTTTSTDTHKKGDANSDGKVSIADARFIAKMLAKRKQDEIPIWADFNDDGKVTIKDARDIAKYIASNRLKS